MAQKKRPELAQSATIAELPAACANEQAAVEFLESKRWGKGATCPECTATDVYKMLSSDGSRNKRYLWRCRDCNRQFTVRTGTVYAESLIPLHKWLRAIWEAATCKNGVSALEMSRRLEVSYKSALFLMHRIRHGMAPTGPEPKLSGTVEADETYVGGKPRYPYMVNGKVKLGRNPNKPKTPVFAMVQRGGEVRARVMATVNGENVTKALLADVDRSANLMTDDANLYKKIGLPFQSHGTVNHRTKEYVNRDNPSIHSNTIENYFSRVKRQLMGTYHAVSPEHLHRYVAHSAFLYNSRTLNDGERTLLLLKSMEGKRLMYDGPSENSIAS